MFYTVAGLTLLVAILSSGSGSVMNWCDEYGRRGDLDKQIEACTQAITSERNSEKALAYLYVNRATAYAGKREYDRAVADYNKAIELDPRNARAYYGRGSVYNYNADFDRAIADYDKALQLYPMHGPSYSNRGNAYARKGEYERAIADYNKALELDPKFIYSYVGLSALHRIAGDYEGAIADCNKAIERGLENTLLYGERAAAYMMRGDYERAIADCTKAIELDPRNARAWYVRASIYRTEDDHDRAIAEYGKAIGLDPRNAQSYSGRGAAYYAQGSFDKAIPDYKKAMELNPKDEHSRLNLLLCLRKVSKESVASSMDTLRVHVNTSPSTEWIRTIAKYYLGLDGLTERKLLEEAQGGKSDKDVRERLCEAYYYLGEERLWKGDRKGAGEFFRKSIETNAQPFIEYTTSKAMLKNMKAGKL